MATNRRNRPEYLISQSLAANLRCYQQLGLLKCLWLHVPNERIVSSGKDFKFLNHQCKMGMQSGAPDFIFLKSDGCLQIELKSEKGRQTENQIKWEKLSKSKDVPYYVCRSVKEAENLLAEFGYLKL